MSSSNFQGTIKPTPGFNPESDAKALREAMKGLGTDEAAIINILGVRTRDERVKIAITYKTLFGKDLIHDLDSELSGTLKIIIDSIIMPPEEYDARELSRAMKGLGTDEHALLEILCTRDSKQIQTINAVYKTLFKAKLEDHIVSDTSGSFQRLMVSLSVGGRQDHQPVDAARARADAQKLFDAGEKCWGTDESMFNQILVAQSYEQLAVVFDEYQKIAGQPIEKSIENEMSGDVRTGMLAIVQCVRNRPAYFAEKLYKSMKGAGTDEKACVRVVSTRCEIDMVQIKQEFQKLYNQSLAEFIKGDFSGDSKKMLLKMIGEN